MRTREKTRRSVTLAFIFLLPLVALAPAGKCDKGGKGSGKAADRSEQEIAVDNLITPKVRENLTNNSQVPELRAIDIEISTFRLKVTLTGKVATAAAREEAIRLARETEVERDGARFKVREVDASNLKVEP